jgi:hypothetical protein
VGMLRPAHGDRAGRSIGYVPIGRTLYVVKVPIACSLRPDDARSQLDEWQEMLRQVMDGAERVSPNRLELGLLPNADIESVISLARREAACCVFFSFAIEIQADRLVLTVEVPNDAVEILDQLVPSTAT